jgi:hypothetical protein
MFASKAKINVFLKFLRYFFGAAPFENISKNVKFSGFPKLHYTIPKN